MSLHRGEAGFVYDDSEIRPEEIQTYFGCDKCMEEMPPGERPQSWARLNVGLTRYGVQVWCVRHDVNVVALKMGVRFGESIALNAPSEEYEVCDFCLSGELVWTFPADDFIHPDVPEASSIGGWGACQLCHDLVMEDNYEALAERSWQVYQSKMMMTPIGEDLTDEHREKLRETVVGIQALFRENRTGAPVRDTDV